MNVLFTVFVAFSCVLLLGSSPSLFLSSVSAASEKAFQLAASLAGLYAFWLGIMQILEKTPALSKTQTLLSPYIAKLFPGETKETQKLICANISANLLGIGNAATPMAIAAIAEMKKNIAAQPTKANGKKEKKESKTTLFSTKKEHKKSTPIGGSDSCCGSASENSNNSNTRASKNMLMLFILNATSLQLIPTTVISLRTAAGSVNPTSILLPSFLASLASTILGVVLINIFEK